MHQSLRMVPALVPACVCLPTTAGRHKQELRCRNHTWHDATGNTNTFAQVNINFSSNKVVTDSQTDLRDVVCTLAVPLAATEQFSRHIVC